MIPSANPTAHQTGDLAWHSTAAIWPDQAAATASLQRSGLDSRHLSLSRQQILEWENAMLLAQHSNTNCSVYDQETDYKPTINTQAEATGLIANSRQYDGGLLSAHISSSGLPQNTWELFNTLGARRSGEAVGLHREGSLGQTSSSPYNSGSLGASPSMGGYSSFQGGNGVSGLYGDPLSAARSSVLGLTSFDQRRLEDIVKRELYATQDFNSMLGLNLGGRTYFSADDYAFSWLGKRLRPMSPSMIQAPLCQAEGCKSDLNMAKHYHRRHKVCEYHSKAATVNTGGGQTQRFCQQCSRFHVLSEFDDGKRSCRKRLADHNRRRRKPQPVSSLAIAEKAKESEEGAGSESLQNGGGQSCKGSPTVGEQPLALASEHESGKRQSMQVSEESMDKTQQEEAQTSRNFKLGSAIASNTIAPGLSLVAQHDKQAANGCEPRSNAADDKRAVPLSQASTNNQLMETSYSSKADHNGDSSGEGDHHHHAEKVASIRHSSIQNLLPTASRNIENSRSWVMKSVGAAAQGSDQMGDRHINQINHRLSGKSGGGGHEVLRLMVGDEMELAGSKRAMHASSTVENLGVFGHQASLSKGQNIIKFSSLQKQQADNLTRPLSKSSIFGSHSHHAHNNML